MILFPGILRAVIRRFYCITGDTRAAQAPHPPSTTTPAPTIHDSVGKFVFRAGTAPGSRSEQGSFFAFANRVYNSLLDVGAGVDDDGWWGRLRRPRPLPRHHVHPCFVSIYASLYFLISPFTQFTCFSVGAKLFFCSRFAMSLMKARSLAPTRGLSSAMVSK